MAPRRTRRDRSAEIVPGDYLTGVSYLPETVSQAPAPATPRQGAVLVPRGSGTGTPQPTTRQRVPLPDRSGGHPPTGLRPAPPAKPRTGRTFGVLVAVAAAVVVAVASGTGDSGNGSGGGSRTDVDDASIARLLDNCTGGYWASCEQLAQWPTASEEDREVGRTCGGRTDGGVDCRTLDEDGTPADTSAGAGLTDQQLDEVWAGLLASGGLTGGHTAEALAAGGVDVPQLLAALQAGCLDHDRDACLHLRQMSIWEPRYLVGVLRTLRAECTAGDDEACTLLGVVAEERTENRAFGRSCGGRADADACT